MSMVKRVERIWAHRKVLGTLVTRDFRVRYARSFLGYLWTLIDPLAMALVYAFVFGVIYQRGGVSASQGVPFVLFLVAGYLPWNWFNLCVNETARALYAERLLVRSTNLPRELWVIRVVISKGLEFLLSLPILVGFMVWFLITTPDEVHLNYRLVYWIPATILLFLLNVDIGLCLAPLTALVGDVVRLVRIGLRLLFYLTPIVYSVHLLDEKAAWAKPFQQANPLTGIVDMFRVGLLDPATQPSNHQAWIIATVFSLLWVVIGMWVFRKLEPAVLKEI